MENEGNLLSFPDEKKNIVSNVIDLRKGRVLSIVKYKNRKIMEEDLAFYGWEDREEKWDRCVEESQRQNRTKTGPGYGRVLDLSTILDRMGRD